MTTRPFPYSLLPPFAIIALVVCPSCTGGPTAASDDTRATFVRDGQQPAATTNAPPSPIRPQAGRPDPRYRPPTSFSELQAVAGEVARASGGEIHWRLALGANPGPLALIRGGLDDCTIHIHPIAARKVPPNTWAFIFGHEFAHRVENLGNHSQSNPSNELKADIAGARYAMAAGYRLEAFLGWVLTEPNQLSDSHGSLHQRVQAIAAHFGIPQSAVQAQAKRYLRYRSTN